MKMKNIKTNKIKFKKEDLITKKKYQKFFKINLRYIVKDEN